MLVYRTCLLICTCLSVLTGALRYRSWMATQPTDGGDQPQAEFFTVPYLTVVPAQSALYPWTFVTTTFVEQNIFTLAIALATLLYGGKYLERAWGSAELVKFLLVTSVVSNFLSFIIYIMWFAITGNVVRS